MLDLPASLPLWFALAAVLGFLLAPFTGQLGARAGLIDYPRPGEVQTQPVPRTGGYGMALAFLVTVGLVWLLTGEVPGGHAAKLGGLALGILVTMPLALVDDARRVGPAPQLLWHLGLGLVAVLCGALIDSVANPFGPRPFPGTIPLPLWVAIPFTIFWVAGMVNTLNWIDTMDGLAAGVSAIAALVLFVLSMRLGQQSVAVLPLILAGVCLGFLPHNFHRARLFMGTCGSVFLGYTLAVLAIIGGAKIATALMVLGVPIFDTAWVILYRTLQGRNPTRGGDNAHLTHRLLGVGMSVRKTVLLLYGLCLGFGLLALTLQGAQKLAGLAALALVSTGLVVVLALRARGAASRPASVDLPVQRTHDVA
jgi:UDP-GlcNAc:undecaprenyl-phosphate GlcNAc-1-phosphate transferase